MSKDRKEYADMIQESRLDSAEIVFQVWLELLKKCGVTSLNKDIKTNEIEHKLWNRKQLVDDLIERNNELADNEMDKKAEFYKIEDYDAFVKDHGGLSRITQSYNYAKKRLEKQMGLDNGALKDIKLPPLLSRRKRTSADFIDIVKDVGIKFEF